MPPPPSAPETSPLLVVTYNIHSGLGDGFSFRQSRAQVESNLREIAVDIAAAAPAGEPAGVVALNEVDFASRRSAWIDESAFLAAELEALTGEHYDIVRGQTWQRDQRGREVRFGNAMLVRLPIVAATSCVLGSRDCEAAPVPDDLPSLRPAGWSRLMFEERGVVKVTIRHGERLVDMLVTHLDAFSARTREAQAMHLLHRFVDPGRTTVLLGDLNAVATELTGKRRFFDSDRTLDILTSAGLADTRSSFASIHGLDSVERWATYPAAAPVWPLDAVLASVDLVPQQIEVIGVSASDHRGLMVRLVAVSGRAALGAAQARHDQVRRQQLDRIRRCDLSAHAGGEDRGWLVARTGFALLGARVP